MPGNHREVQEAQLGLLLVYRAIFLIVAYHKKLGKPCGFPEAPPSTYFVCLALFSARLGKKLGEE